jgi:hypothetical protein
MISIPCLNSNMTSDARWRQFLDWFSYVQQHYFIWPTSCHFLLLFQ